MHPDLYLLLHQQRERELLERQDRVRRMRERGATRVRPRHEVREAWLAARAAVGAVSRRAGERVVRVGAPRDIACCATA